MGLPDAQAVDKFAPFHHIKAIPYSHLNGHPILVDVLIPRTVSAISGPRPVFVNIHGGCLITASRDFQPFWGKWVLEEALNQNAILVAPDYPLAPESKTPEMVSALRSFMDWLLGGSLQQELDARAPELNIHADVQKLSVVGESAGGWGALHLGLDYPEQIRSLILRFPMVDLESDWFTKPQGLTQVFDIPLPPSDFLDKYLQDLVPGKVVSSGASDRFPLVVAAIGYARVLELLGTSEETFPLHRLRAGIKLPKRVWVFHGQDDDVVPVTGAERTVALIREHVPETHVEFDTRPGRHGFDGEWSIKDEPVIETRLAWLREAWLA